MSRITHRAASLLSSLPSPCEDARSPLSYVETVETSPVEELRNQDTYIRPPTPEPDFTGLGGQAEKAPVDVRLLPLAFAATYWCGLAVLYAFLFYVTVQSPTWRGPVVIWAALIPTVVFALWRHLPAEELRVHKLSEEIVLLRCGGYYGLGEQRPVAMDVEEMTERRTQAGEPPRRGTNITYSGLA